jgi:hypothetical protein
VPSRWFADQDADERERAPAHPPLVGVGLLVGGLLAVLFLMTLLAKVMAREHRQWHEWHCQCTRAMPYYEAYLLWLSIAVLVGGYSAGVILRLRYSTRGLGEGVLVGLTLVIPLGIFVYFMAAWGRGGG